MRKISRIAVLYISNLLFFMLAFGMHFFDAFVFKSISIKIAQLPFHSLFTSLLITLWMLVPQTIIFFGINRMFLKIPTKKFFIGQLLFAVSIVLILSVLLLTFK